MQILSIDLETFSDIDIITSGVYKYVESENFEILLFAYAYDNEKVQIIDMTKEGLPEHLLDALLNPHITKSAFNSNFERVALSRFLNIKLDPSYWICAMVEALTMGLPSSLGMVGKAMHFDEDKQKMREGKALIQYFCKPCRPTKTNNERLRNLPAHDPEKWETFKAYCIQDVEVERDIRNQLSRYKTTEKEQRLWELDQRINDRGVGVDLTFVKQAIKCDVDYSRRLENEARELTGLSNPNSPAQLKKWIGDRVGHEVTSLTKDSVPVLIKETNDEDVKRILELRQLMSRTSTKKYEAMINAYCMDTRAHGLLQFYGANRTGRWSGRLVQVQNLPQNHLPDLDDARNCIREGRFDDVEFLYDSIPDTLSQLIRTAFIPKQGNRFIVSDFSAIEARVIAWLAEEQWRIDVFNTHGKIYEASASQMFRVPLESIKKGSDLRQKGKIAELACIAEDQLVLTDKGLVKIQDVTTAMRVWDGIEFVNHGGVIFKGVKEVITYGGLTATEDHLVWVTGQEKSVRFGQSAASGAHLIQTGDGRRAIRFSENNKCREEMVKELESLQGTDTMHELRECSVDGINQSDPREVERLPGMLTAEENPEMAGQKIHRRKTALHEPGRCKLQKLRGEGHKIQIRFCAGSRAVDDRKLRACRSFNGAGQNRYEWALRAREFAVGYTSRKLPESKKVYDILDCGPRHRFTVSDVLVHNCGYGGGVGALKAMDRNHDIPEDILPELVKNWRVANPYITKFWWDCDSAAKKAIEERTTVNMQFGIKFIYEPGVLFIQLPSGRRLSYIRPKIAPGPYDKPVITYEGMEQTTKQWTTLNTYGPKIVENIVQATARDCLAEAMFKVDAAGYDIVMHVHDEVIIDAPKGFGSLEEVNAIFGESIDWAPGLPLRADGYECEYYKKD